MLTHTGNGNTLMIVLSYVLLALKGAVENSVIMWGNIYQNVDAYNFNEKTMNNEMATMVSKTSKKTFLKCFFFPKAKNSLSSLVCIFYFLTKKFQSSNFFSNFKSKQQHKQRKICKKEKFFSSQNDQIFKCFFYLSLSPCI